MFILFLRSLALSGSILLLWAESLTDKKTVFAGLPAPDKLSPRMIFQLIGRLSLPFMFITLIHFELELIYILENVIGTIMILLISFGYKTKFASLVLVIWLIVINFYTNAWWMAPPYQPLRDYLRYDFFQTLSITGGLLLIFHYGPGDLSLDERKKQW